MIEEKVIQLKKHIVEYAGLVEGMVRKSMKGLIEKNKLLLLEVMDKDEPKANNYELEMDEMCTNIIAQFQPKAKNLRLILMASKMSTDLERMGDHAVNIVQSALYLVDYPNVKPLVDLPKMGEITIGMLSDSINSFVNEDGKLAKAVCERDSLVDDLKGSISKELTTIMTEDSKTIDRSLNILRIVGNLERIADLSTNIGEDVLFLAEGRVIKHHKEEK
ncbi:MAG: phosphate signaling complex protein PhoU [Elusimicrobia bacterium]|nr:phosphate signaling complex protein PhoU [Elusimicrobiota bacterium]